MGEACHTFAGSPHLQASLHGASTTDHDYTTGSPLGAPVGHWVWGVATQVTMRMVVITPLKVTLSLVSEPKPPPLSGALIGKLLWSDTSVMGLTKLSME
jgi:hypothetical protein